MRVIRADDGEAFDVNATLLDIEQTSPLKAFLSDVTAIDANAIICFLADGTQLRNENLRENSGVQDQTIYVFNRESLELPVDQIMAELMVEPQLQPEVDASTYSNTSATNAAFARAANLHYQRLLARASTAHAQIACLSVASLNLDSHVLALSSAFDVFAGSAQRELERQSDVLRGHATDMEVIGKVKVHVEFLSPNVRRAVELGGKERFLGDYVSGHKMRLVADNCAKIHEDLVQRFNATRHSMHDLTTGADEVRAGTVNPYNADIEHCVRRAKDLFSSIAQASQDVPFDEMHHLDELLREEVRAIADLKNRVTTHCVDVLRNVSRLQSMLADLPPTLTTLESDLRTKAGFPHLQRLHNMLYFYGATMIEIVRRTEFCKLFMERSQTIAEMMAKLSNNEKKRRQVYRSEVHGQLPFEAKGMDDPIPTLEVETKGTTRTSFSITREDLIEFLGMIDEIADTVVDDEDGVVGVVNPVKETRAALEKHIVKIDALESDFDKLAEKSIMSASWSANFSKRRSSNEVPAAAYREAIQQLEEKAEQEKTLRDDVTRLSSDNARLQAELEQMRSERDSATSQLKQHITRTEALEDQLDVIRDTLQSESAARRSLEQRHSNSLREGIEQAKLLEDALRESGRLRAEVVAGKEELNRVCELNRASDARVEALLRDQASTLAEIEGTRDLEAQLALVKREGESALRALAEENARLVKTQDRLLKDQVDGDRAEVERKAREVEEVGVLLRMERDDRARAEKESDAELVALRTRLMAEADVLRRDVDAGRLAVQDLRTKMAGQQRVDGEIVRLVMKILDVSAKAMATVQKYSLAGSSSSSSKNQSKSIMAASITSPAEEFDAGGSMIMGQSNFPSSSSFPPSGLKSPISSRASIPPEEALAALSTFDLDAFADTMGKAGLTIRKWQKQARDYRDRSKSKITYHNFQRGDLALFLPTRNSVAKPWAAFNVSFPHYFLHVEGHLAEQLKTREWVVARITNILQRVADSEVPDSNPYGLGNGVKYFMLEVEDWTQPQAQLQSQPGTNKNGLGMSTPSLKPPRKGDGKTESARIKREKEPLPPPPETEPSPTPVPAPKSPLARVQMETTDGWPQIRSSEREGEGEGDRRPLSPSGNHPGIGIGIGSSAKTATLQHAMARSPTGHGPFVPLLEPTTEEVPVPVQPPPQPKSPIESSWHAKRGSTVDDALLEASKKGKEKENNPADTVHLASSPTRQTATPSSLRSPRTSTPLSVPFSGRSGSSLGGLNKRASAVLSADVSAGTSPGAVSFISGGSGSNDQHKAKASAVTGTTDISEPAAVVVVSDTPTIRPSASLNQERARTRSMMNGAWSALWAAGSIGRKTGSPAPPAASTESSPPAGPVAALLRRYEGSGVGK